jgi:hypothetical protein
MSERTARAPRCADLSAAIDEDMPGTASTIKGWLLVEQGGAWGRDATTANQLPDEVAAHLRRVATQARLRLLLIRRPPHYEGERGSGQRLFVARPQPGRGQLVAASFDDPTDLLGLDGSVLGTAIDDAVPPAPAFGLAPADSPANLLLVCTHGSHDPCCGLLGRGVALALDGAPEVWESSHVGGDRFAANVVVVPAGSYYGRVPPERATALLEAAREGRVVADLYRGRVVFGFAEQVGEAFLREATDTVRVEALTLLDAQRNDVGNDRTEVTIRFAIDGNEQPPVLVQGQKSEPRPLTCHGRPAPAWEFTARWLHPEPVMSPDDGTTHPDGSPGDGPGE